MMGVCVYLENTYLPTQVMYSSRYGSCLSCAIAPGKGSTVTSWTGRTVTRDIHS